MTDIVLGLLLFGLACLLFLTGYACGRRLTLQQWRASLLKTAWKDRP